MNIFKFYNNFAGLPLPPDAIVTRWGTWIQTGVFYCNNYNKIVDFVNALPDDNTAASVKVAKRLVENDILKDELVNVATFSVLAKAIQKLEKRGLSKDEQWKIYNDVSLMMDGFAKEKFTASLGRNPDVLAFVTEKNPEIRLKSMFAPLVSVDVERSFSQYKMILSDRRQNLTFDNIQMMNVIMFNKFLFD